MGRGSSRGPDQGVSEKLNRVLWRSLYTNVSSCRNPQTSFPPSQIRWFCTAGISKEDKKKLFKHIYKLYAIIHPDKLATLPQQRDVNLQSFQILNSAVQRNYESPNDPDPISRPTLLTFFYHDHDRVRNVRVQLGPGARALADALRELFSALGLDLPPANILRPPEPPLPHLRAFNTIQDLSRAARMMGMKRAHVKQKMAAEAAEGIAQKKGDAQVMVLAMQRNHGVTFEIDESVRNTRPAIVLARVRDAMMDAVHALNASMQQPPFRGARIVIDASFDARILDDPTAPTVLLGACASRGQWDDVLQDESLRTACLQFRERAAELRRLEVEAASVLGVSIVLHNIGEETAEYRDLVEKLAEGAESEEELGIALMFVEGEDVDSDAKSGLLTVGIGLDVDEVRKTLREVGRKVAVEHAKLEAAREARETNKRMVVRALRIGALEQDADVSDKQFGECLTMLRSKALQLKGLLEGADVRVVVGEPGVSEDGEIHLPFDFATRMKV